VQIFNKLVEVNTKQTNLLQTATVQSEGQVKIDLEKALETSKLTMEQAVENIERAGLKVEDSVIMEDSAPEANTVQANGNLTAVAEDSINIGTARFYLTNETVYVNITKSDLKVDLAVSVKGMIEDERTIALEIKTDLVPETPVTPDPGQ